MYGHLASFVSYPDAQLFRRWATASAPLSSKPPRRQPCSKTSVMLPRCWGQAPWKKPTSRHLKCRPRLRSTSVTNSLAKTGAGAPLWPV